MGKDKKSKSKRHYDVEMDPDSGLDKKQTKKLRKQAEKVAKVFGYTNDTNPFGDSNLLQPFVWGKKKDKDKSEGKVEKDDEVSRLKLMKDIDRVRKRRVDRENELEEMERLRAEEQRLREASQYENWEEKEEEFHTQQTKVRSKIRLIERREQPIDILARNILLIESFNSTEKEEMDLGASLAALENLHVELSEPLAVVDDLDEEELSELMTDLDKYLEIEVKNSGSYVGFWTALKEVTAATLKHRKNRSSGVHKAVKADVKKIMGGKVSQELKLLLEDIRKSIREGKRSDVEYWEQMEQEVAVEFSRAIVREVHCDLLRQQLAIVTTYKAEQKLKIDYKTDAEREQEEKEAAARLDYRFISSSGGGSSSSSGDPNNDPNKEQGITDYMRDMRAQVRQEDLQMDNSDQAVALQQAERSKGLGDHEEAMASNDEVAMQAKFYHWQDKYRPRKPRYFNRVKTGYDWNKYNSTHYDRDNPPPKTVQGYKFNVFFPDLIDKAHTPKYFVEPCEESEYAILRIHSGPPYEDVAFKIINHEWEIGRKSGFKCVFERGVLQLYFNFKRHRYRS